MGSIGLMDYRSSVVKRVVRSSYAAELRRTAALPIRGQRQVHSEVWRLRCRRCDKGSARRARLRVGPAQRTCSAPRSTSGSSELGQHLRATLSRGSWSLRYAAGITKPCDQEEKRRQAVAMFVVGRLRERSAATGGGVVRETRSLFVTGFLEKLGRIAAICN